MFTKAVAMPVPRHPALMFPGSEFTETLPHAHKELCMRILIAALFVKVEEKGQEKNETVLYKNRYYGLIIC